MSSLPPAVPGLMTPEDRYRQLANDVRRPLFDPSISDEESPGLFSAFGASLRTQNTLGSAFYNWLPRLMGDVPLFRGDQFTGSFRPESILTLDFLQENPAATSAIDQLTAASDRHEFDFILHNAERTYEDFRTLSQFSFLTNLAIGIGVGIIDPVNLIPLGWGLKAIKGAKTVNLINNAARLGTIGAIGNVIQEGILFEIDPSRPIEKDAALRDAAVMGALFGGFIGFMSAPAFKISKSANAGVSRKAQKLKEGLTRAFESPDPKTGQRARSYVDEIEKSQQHVQSKIDDLESKPVTQSETVTVLETPETKPLIDKLRLRFNQKRPKAPEGQEPFELTIGEHGMQADYNAFTPLEKNLNSAQVTLNTMLAADTTGGAKATPGELGARETGISLISKALSIVTPTGVFDRSILDMVKTTRRILFYDGSISKAAADDPLGHAGPPSAEGFKDMFQVILGRTKERLSAAWKNAGEVIDAKNTRGLVAALSRKQISWTDVGGRTQMSNSQKGFMSHVVDILRLRKARHDGFIDDAAMDNMKVPKQLDEATKAVNDFFKEFLDLADQVGLLPGEGTRVKADAKVEELQTKQNELIAKQAELQAEADAAAPGVAAAPEVGVVEPYTTAPVSWQNQVLQLERDGLKSQGGEAWTYSEGLTRIDVGEDPTLIRILRQITGEIWEVRERRFGKLFKPTHYLTHPRLIEKARGIIKSTRESRLEGQIRAVERKLGVAQKRAAEVAEFASNAKFYFTRRFNVEEMRRHKKDVLDWFVKSWHKARGLTYDADTGANKMEGDSDFWAIIPEVRKRMKLGEEVVLQKDLTGDLKQRYEDEVHAYFMDTAESTYKKITAAENSHGMDHAIEGGSPLMKRRLTLDESSDAAKQFLDDNIENILMSYWTTVGGMVATRTAIKRSRHLLGKLGEDVETPKQLLDVVDNQFQELVNVTQSIDDATGSSLTPGIQRDHVRSMERLRRRADNLEGRYMINENNGSHAMLMWGGRQVSTTNYLALLGSQFLSMVIDATTMVMFTDFTSIPRNVKIIANALRPLKDASRRELKMHHMAYEQVNNRQMVFADTDFDDPGAGVGFGATRKFTGAIGSGLNRMGMIFNEISLANTWNRYAKRSAAFLTMDRMYRLMHMQLKMAELVKKGMSKEKAASAAGFKSGFDAAWLANNGINVDMTRRIMALTRKYGSTMDGQKLADMDPAQLDSYTGIMLPDGAQWLKGEGDAARLAFDTMMIAINTNVERAMIITPGLTDRPLMSDTWWGRHVNQFQSFNFTFANQVVRPLAQRPAGKQIATIMAYMASGTVVDAIRNDLSGRRSIDKTIELWDSDPFAMTYAVVNTSGLTGWFNRPLGFFDKMHIGPSALLGTDPAAISRAPFQARSVWGSLSPSVDMAERFFHGASGLLPDQNMTVARWHALRKTVPFQNLLWFRAMNRFTGIDPYLTENLVREQKGEMEPRP